jgi:hypothetical protein
MTTDFTPEAPHKDYRATLKLTGTKEEFEELRQFLEASELRETRDSKVTDNVIDELDGIIRCLGEMNDTCHLKSDDWQQ